MSKAILKDSIFKLIDTILGEKMFAEDISYITIGDIPTDPEKEGYIEMADLEAYLVWEKRKIKD